MNVVTSQEKSNVLHAAQIGDVSAIEIFHKNHPDVHWREIRHDKLGDTILHISARLGHIEFVKYLLRNYSCDAVNFQNKDCKTPLHEAAQFSQANAIKILLRYGADVNVLKRADWTPLMLACTKDDYECVQLLLEADALVNVKNKDGWTALHLISRVGDDILRSLCKRNLDVFANTNNGRSALHIACLHGNLDVVARLVELGLDVNVRDTCGSTPLHEAVLGGHVRVCDYLLKCNADLCSVNGLGFGVMHLAASVGDLTMIWYLYSLSVDVNARNRNKLTPLHCAACKQHTDTVRTLIQLGALETVDDFGRLPSDYLDK
ncbi:hypothetical protein RI129_012230 [Pyrocoelia pectoralis]|uniref:Ankyrin repeat domain-containing protein 16 n=1 Tax=Pyrocoelia pectoralis TaxID=417401 RepID=A0AAN7USP3_9COLE